MRFIHISDVNIGADPDSDKSWGKERAGDFKETLERVVDRAKEIDCDLLLISGNLFCHQPVTSELFEINLLFSRIPATQIVITAGSRDRLRRNSSVRNFKWSNNVHYALSDGHDSIKLPALHTVVYALSLSDKKTDIGSELLKIKEEAKEEKDYVSILVMGEDKRRGGSPAPEEPEESLWDSELTYCALGGKGEHTEPGRMKCAYPGYLSPLGMENPGDHGMLTGDISIASKRILSLEFVKMSRVSYIPIRIEINEGVGNAELMRTVESEIKRRGEENIYKLRITGKRNPETELDLSPLKKTGRIEDIVDETEPEYDFSKLFEEHTDDIIGFYIGSVMKDSEEEPQRLEKKAMYYAVDALLATERRSER